MGTGERNIEPDDWNDRPGQVRQQPATQRPETGERPKSVWPRRLRRWARFRSAAYIVVLAPCWMTGNYPWEKISRVILSNGAGMV